VFEEYLNKPDETADAFLDGRYLTGDLLRRNEDGYFGFVSRKDDLIISSGYRISPIEVEDAVLRHDDVKNVAVVGEPHDTRGEIVKAYVLPTAGADTDDLPDEIQQSVREDLAAHKYPREVELVEDIPTTTTGKIKRADGHSLSVPSII